MKSLRDRTRSTVLTLALFALTECSAARPRLASAQHYTGPMIDVHTHMLPDREAMAMNPQRSASATALFSQMTAAGVRQAGILAIAPRGDLARTRLLNDTLQTVWCAHPDRFLPIGSVHPADGDATITELERIAALGFYGLKLHPNTQRFDVAAPEVARVVARAAELRLPVLFGGWSPFDSDQTGKLLRLAMTVPTADIIIAHLGGARFSDMLVFAVLRQHYPSLPRNV